MAENQRLKDRLNEIAREVESGYGTKVFFCEIIGNRWSFFAGDITLDIPEHRIMLSNDYGMMAGEISCSDKEWEQIINRIKILF